MKLSVEKISRNNWFLSLFDKDSDWPTNSKRIFSKKVDKLDVAELISFQFKGISFETRPKLVETAARVLPEDWNEGIYDMDGYIIMVELLR